MSLFNFQKHNLMFVISLRCSFALLLLMLITANARAQSGTNSTGNGGRHTIQGRIYLPSGRTSDIMGVKVKLESISSGELITFADNGGSYGFKNVISGSYYIVIEASEYFEAVREAVYIGDPGSSSIGGGAVASTGMGHIVNVPLYLQPKKSNANNSANGGVVNAQLAGVPQPAVELYEKAITAKSSNDSNAAIENLKQAISLYPNFSLALNELGVQYLKLNMLKEAKEAFRSSIRVSSDAFAPRLNLAMILFQANDNGEAEKELREAIKINDSSWHAHYYLGRVQIKLRNFDGAEKELIRALNLGGESAGIVHYYLGGIYWGKKQYKQAADALEKYLQLTPNASDADRVRKTVADLRSKQ